MSVWTLNVACKIGLDYSKLLVMKLIVFVHDNFSEFILFLVEGLQLNIEVLLGVPACFSQVGEVTLELFDCLQVFSVLLHLRLL